MADWDTAREALRDIQSEIRIFETTIEEKLKAVAYYRHMATSGRDIDDLPIDAAEAADAVLAIPIANMNTMWSRQRAILQEHWIELSGWETK